jgi:hypothetical protein
MNSARSMHPLNRAAEAIIAGQVAARDALRALGIDPKHLVLNLVWTEPESTWACANVIPPRCDELLVASLSASHDEAVESHGGDAVTLHGQRISHPIGTVWTQQPRPCSGCGREFQALCKMTDDRELCIACQLAEKKA